MLVVWFDRYLLCGETVRGDETDRALRDVSSHYLAGMELNELMDMISCMIRVAWAASVGKLHLSSSMQPTKDPTVYGRLRQSSAGVYKDSSSKH